MEKEVEKFLQAEEIAVKLVETLKKLHSEATSYQTATKELDIVRQQLLRLIELTEDVLKDTHKIIKILKEIGTPEILQRISDVEKRIIVKVDKQTDMLANIEKKVDEGTINLSQISKKITGIESKINEEFNNQTNSMNKLKILIIVLLASSITSTIIALLR